MSIIIIINKSWNTRRKGDSDGDDGGCVVGGGGVLILFQSATVGEEIHQPNKAVWGGHPCCSHNSRKPCREDCWKEDDRDMK